MGFLSDKEVDERVKSPQNLVNRLEIHKTKKGDDGRPSVPLEIRKAIAILANEGETQTSLAKAFDVSQNTVHHIENGRTTYQPQSALKEVIDQVNIKKKEAESIAIDSVLTSIGLLTPEKLKGVAKAKDLASIAKDMSVIAKNMDSTVQTEKDRVVHLHLYSPEQKKLSDYETIDVG